MRARVGLGIALLGALLVLLGLALMVVLGPDGRVTSGPHALETDGIAVVTAPKVVTWSGVRVTVLAELPVNKPVFIGLGNAVDVDDYIGNTQRLEVDAFHTPWKVRTRAVKGRANLPGAPTALDWWLARDAGLGGASIDTTLPDQTVSLAILSVGFSNLKGLKVTVAYGLKGGFAMGSGLALLGVAGVLLGLLLRRDKELWRESEADVDEVVYLLVDEDGVEHEISAADAAAYDVEEVTVEDYVVDGDGDEVGELPEPEPEPEPEREPEPPAAAAPVVYVFIDEHGVEHQVSEDELADYDIVDDDGKESP